MKFMGAVTTPTGDAGRIEFLDILRGLAVLAIFAVNIKAMMAPFPYYMNASLWPGAQDINVAAVQAFLIDDKWRTIFTMLFGAGLGLIADRLAKRGSGDTGILLRRLSLLGLFGLIHLLAIWNGDILVTYALSGMIALLFRKMSAENLLRWLIGCFVVGFIWTSLFSVAPGLIPEVRAEVEPFLWGTDAEFMRENTELLLGGVAGHFQFRVESAIEYIFFYFLMGGHWLDTLAIMLAGIWAYRIGFFTAALSQRTYVLTAFIGLGVAFSIDTVRWVWLTGSGWDFVVFCLTEPLNQFDGYAGAAGFSGLIGLLVKVGWRPRAVAAAGRMAFTNYIACSVVGTTLAYGHGFGLFGALTNLQLMGIVAATWLAILIWSPISLRYFRFGPLEWLWRSLTYGKVQPFRRLHEPRPAT